MTLYPGRGKKSRIRGILTRGASLNFRTEKVPSDTYQVFEMTQPDSSLLGHVLFFHEGYKTDEFLNKREMTGELSRIRGSVGIWSGAAKTVRGPLLWHFVV